MFHELYINKVFLNSSSLWNAQDYQKTQILTLRFIIVAKLQL